MRIFLLSLILLLPMVADAIPALAPLWQIDKKASSVRFTADFNGQKMTGRFPEFDTSVRFDPENIAGSSVTVTVRMDIIGADDADVRMTLPQRGWFAAGQYPRATFQSKTIRHLADNRYEAIGVLTIKNMSADLAVPFTLTEYREDAMQMRAQVDGNAVISRMQYKVGEGEWAKPKPLADAVLVEFTVKATRKL